MQASPFMRLGVRLPAMAHPWLALAATASLWLLLLLFGAVLFAPPAANQPVTALAPLAVLSPLQAGVVMVFVGFCSAAAMSPEVRAATRILPLGLILGLWGGVLTAYQHHYGLPETGSLVGFGLVGLVIGFAAGLMISPTLRRRQRDGKIREQLLAYLALGSAIILTLAPLTPTNPLTDPFGAFDPLGLVTRVPQQFYSLIKASMLWVPLGFVLAAGGLSALPRRWVPAGFATFFVVGWPFFGALLAKDLIEVLAAPLGIWVGLWLGERTRGFEEAPDPRARAVQDAPKKHPAAAEDQRLADATRPRLSTLERLAPAAPARTKLPDAPVAYRATGAVSSETVQPVSASSDASSGPAPRSPASHNGLAFTFPRPHPLGLLPAVGLLVLAAWGWWEFPRFQLSLGLALLVYFLLLTVFRHAWLVVVPAVLPALDLAPWTGRFFLDESDLFLTVTLGAAFLHRPAPEAGPYLARPIAVLGGLFGVTTLIALLIGLLPLSPFDANAFASYFSHYNALRIGKGFVWGLAFFLLLRWTVPRGSELPSRLFTAGVLFGLLGVILIGLRERWQFADLLDFSAAYRITASFSSMHTGGSHLPAFLALAVPFVWLWVVRRRDLVGLAIGPILFAGAVYLVVSTVTRASVLALAVELVLLALFWLRSLSTHRARIALPLLAFGVIAASAGSLLVLGTQGSYFQQRMATVERDTETRLDHWGQAVSMMDRDPATLTFGMGLGAFPETYLQRNPLGHIPGNFRYAAEGGNEFLLLGSGETLYLAQRVPAQPDTDYRLAFDLRGESDRVRLTMPLCEKHLLDSRKCVWNTYQVPGNGEWQHKEVTLSSGRIGRGGVLQRPPVELFLYNGEKDQLVAVDNLSLRAPDGTELLRNGDFSAGGDYWFFKTHDHLAWHIKNLWVSLLFEQGLAGLIAFNLFVFTVLVYLSGPAWRGVPAAAAALTAVIGFLTLGLFSSPFDAPRLTALFFAVLAIGLHSVPAITPVRSTRRPRRRSRGKRRRSRTADVATPS